MASRKERMTLRSHNGSTVIDLGQVEIWDGADLALLRETLTRLVQRERARSVGVDMTTVKYIPSGFFGMLVDWLERGVTIRLYTPQPRVANMLWFRQFFESEGNGSYRLLREPKELMTFDESCDWGEEEAWVEQPRPSVASVSQNTGAPQPSHVHP